MRMGGSLTNALHESQMPAGSREEEWGLLADPPFPSHPSCYETLSDANKDTVVVVASIEPARS